MFEQEQNGLDQTASAAHTVQSTIKTGKAVDSAAKSAAMGGLYGAAAGLVQGAKLCHPLIPNASKAWDLSIILNEAGHRTGAGGPFWIIGP